MKIYIKVLPLNFERSWESRNTSLIIFKKREREKKKQGAGSSGKMIKRGEVTDVVQH